MADLSETKRHLLGSLKTTLDSEYVFQVPYGEGPVVVQRIRVELSRIKKAYQKNARALALRGESAPPMTHFKLHANIKPNREGDYDEVILTRSQTGVQKQSREMTHMFNSLLSEGNANNG